MKYHHYSSSVFCQLKIEAASTISRALSVPPPSSRMRQHKRRRRHLLRAFVVSYRHWKLHLLSWSQVLRIVSVPLGAMEKLATPALSLSSGLCPGSSSNWVGWQCHDVHVTFRLFSSFVVMKLRQEKIFHLQHPHTRKVSHPPAPFPRSYLLLLSSKKATILIAARLLLVPPLPPPLP